MQPLLAQLNTLLFISAMIFSTYATATHVTGSDKQMADEILVYINQYRTQHGLPKLLMEKTLVYTAQKHSQAMAVHAQPFGHGGFQQRISYLHQHIPHSTSGAENVAYNYKTAKIVAEGWIHSAGHRHNILGHYDLTGVAIVRDNHGRPYFTQIFLRKDQASILTKRHVIPRGHQVAYHPPAFQRILSPLRNLFT